MSAPGSYQEAAGPSMVPTMPPSYEEVVVVNSYFPMPPAPQTWTNPPMYCTQPVPIPSASATSVLFQLEGPVQMCCSFYNKRIGSRLSYNTSSPVHPFLIWTFDVDHYCPNCKAFLGTYKRL
ncbi:unnamed protein product [Nyctereutes procyonoides]|uniref:(raccoon dog) hypothetical protein n=1 Tax=Nyctereutes procyonoides TaxID=34880 RepID=A0A811YFG2_NYCPR|nr:unnamed protein product [Nyctereutes procyonoides]